mmetsp:Transcript_31904/g.91547  ORF Transcript_31904/g.91547 Transcript_31904/m.91547 type:complete len:289 (-) Transcript_31904:31-897(-)
MFLSCTCRIVTHLRSKLAQRTINHMMLLCGNLTAHQNHGHRGSCGVGWRHGGNGFATASDAVGSDLCALLVAAFLFGVAPGCSQELALLRRSACGGGKLGGRGRRRGVSGCCRFGPRSVGTWPHHSPPAGCGAGRCVLTRFAVAVAVVVAAELVEAVGRGDGVRLHSGPLRCPPRLAPSSLSQLLRWLRCCWCSRCCWCGSLPLWPLRPGLRRGLLLRLLLSLLFLLLAALLVPSCMPAVAVPVAASITRWPALRERDVDAHEWDPKTCHCNYVSYPVCVDARTMNLT